MMNTTVHHQLGSGIGRGQRRGVKGGSTQRVSGRPMGGLPSRGLGARAFLTGPWGEGGGVQPPALEKLMIHGPR